MFDFRDRVLWAVHLLKVLASTGLLACREGRGGSLVSYIHGIGIWLQRIAIWTSQLKKTISSNKTR